MKQEVHELRTLRSHQSARRRHKRRVKTEERLVNVLAKAGDRTDEAATKHRETRQTVKDLFA